ncbi:MAG: NADH-quinone oxidoreductase subunit J, partial [Candidatus Altarchaeaceae archaeon]
MYEILFYISGILAIIFGILVLLSRNIMHSLIFLAGFFLSVALIFMSIYAYFLFAIQILIYIGGVITLI